MFCLSNHATTWHYGFSFVGESKKILVVYHTTLKAATPCATSLVSPLLGRVKDIGRLYHTTLKAATPCATSLVSPCWGE